MKLILKYSEYLSPLLDFEAIFYNFDHRIKN